MPIQYLTAQPFTLKNVEIVVDTNILIMLFDNQHDRHRGIKKVVESLVQNECTLTYFVVTKLELYHYFSTRLFARFLKQYKGHLLQKVQSLQDHINEIDYNYISQDQVKALREDVLAVPKGPELWKELLSKSMSKVEQNLKALTSISSIKYKSKSMLTFTQDPSWDDVEKLMTNQLMGSNDSAIFNMFECSNLIYFMTADSDFEYLFNYRGISTKILLKYP